MLVIYQHATYPYKLYPGDLVRVTCRDHLLMKHGHIEVPAYPLGSNVVRFLEFESPLLVLWCDMEGTIYPYAYMLNPSDNKIYEIALTHIEKIY